MVCLDSSLLGIVLSGNPKQAEKVEFIVTAVIGGLV